MQYPIYDVVKNLSTGSVGVVEDVLYDKRHVRWIIKKDGKPVNKIHPLNGRATWVDEKKLRQYYDKPN